MIAYGSREDMKIVLLTSFDPPLVELFCTPSYEI